MNPYLPECRGSEAFVGAVLEAPLVVGPKLEHRPLLAETIPSYEAGTLSLAPQTVELRLRDDVAFSDGDLLTSADVEWTYKQAVQLAKAGALAPLYSGFSRIARIEAPDQRTVRLVFEEPYAPWRDLLTAPVMPRHVYEGRDFGSLSLNEELLGSGPFLLKSKGGGEMNFTENQRYWVQEPPLPNLGGLRVRFPEVGEMSESLSDGRTDFGFLATGNVPASGDLLRAAAAPVRVEQLLFNSRQLRSREQREAIARALNREDIAEKFGADAARSFVAPEFVPGYVGAWEDFGGEQTFPETSTLQAWPLNLVYPEGGGEMSRSVATTVASDLSAAGFGTEVRAVPAGEFFGEVLPGGSYDLALLTGGTPAEYGMLLQGLPPESRAKLAKSLKTLDREERAAALAEAQRAAAEEAAMLPLFVWPDTLAWSSYLKGLRSETPYRGLTWNTREWAFYK